MSEHEGRRRVQEITAAMFNLSGDLCELLDEIEQLSPHQPGAEEAADRLGPELVKELRQMQGDLSNLAETVENHCGIVAYDGRGAKSTMLTKREVFASRALQGLVTALRSTSGEARLAVATAAVEYADALIAKLGEEQAAFPVWIEGKRPPFWHNDVRRMPERQGPPAERSCDRFRGPRGACAHCGWPAEKHANGGPTPDARGCKGFQEDCCGDRCAFCLLSREAHEPAKIEVRLLSYPEGWAVSLVRGDRQIVAEEMIGAGAGGRAEAVAATMREQGQVWLIGRWETLAAQVADR